MKERILDIFKLTGVYVGLVIGAGFASGREIMTFFIRFGRIWPLGIVLTGVMFSALGYMIMSIIEKRRIKTYSAFVRTIMGEKTAVLTETISGLFLCVLFFAMVAGTGALFNEAFGINSLIGSSIMSLFCFFVFIFGMDAVIKVNAFLSPVMVIGTVLVCLVTYFTDSKSVFMPHSLNGNIPIFIIFSALIYVSYNIITAVSVFIEAEPLINKDKRVKLSGIFGGIIMSVLGIMLGIVLFAEKELAASAEIPILAVIRDKTAILNYIYILVILGAIVTTAVGNGYGAAKWIEYKMQIRPIFIQVGLCLCAVIFSLVGFSGFTDKLYPLFGYLGLLEIFYIFKYSLMDK